MRIISKQGQWLGDVAIQTAGSVESLLELAILNDMSITGHLIIGSEIKEPEVIDKRITSYYKRNEILPATTLTKELLGGIGYMGIEINFIVS